MPAGSPTGPSHQDGNNVDDDNNWHDRGNVRNDVFDGINNRVFYNRIDDFLNDWHNWKDIIVDNNGQLDIHQRINYFNDYRQHKPEAATRRYS